jgi:DDE family transposase
MRDYFSKVASSGHSVQVSIDGKSLHGSIGCGQTQGVHLLGAFVPEQGWVLMQVEVDGKENEITAAPWLLKSLDLRGKVVSGDAMFTQRELWVQIVDSGGDYLWLVKDNQPQLLDDISTVFEPDEPILQRRTLAVQQRPYSGQSSRTHRAAQLAGKRTAARLPGLAPCPAGLHAKASGRAHSRRQAD